MPITKEERDARIKELTGSKVFHLKLLRFYYKSVSATRNEPWWECECECGKMVKRKEAYIIRGDAKSCGCQHPLKGDNRITGEQHPNYKGYGKVSGEYICNIKARAKMKKHEWSVDKKYLSDLYEKQNKKCALTKVNIQFVTKRTRCVYGEQTASLDRIDSTKGYVEGNVQWVHKDINFMKQQFEQEKFIQWCKLIAEHN